MENKHFIATGHTRINPRFLEVVLFDTPYCQGEPSKRLCRYTLRCHHKCYEALAKECVIYKYYKRTYDKFGVVRR